ncbi:YlzJ-like family protein [Paenibacillus sp. MBLB4367]|uniref:YlzJ-like family protein n=1 Tax=Paenibacillus sp. MBLB4367 TaxID=3384767 RepID=UPI003907F954
MTVIYSAVAPETLWEGFGKEPSFVDVTINGMNMQVEMLNMQQAKVVRLYSPNPNDYLNPAYMPGSIIEFHP